MEILAQYWGKADKEFKYHLLAYHSLDVAAVAKAYLKLHPTLLNWFAKQFNLDKHICLNIILYFIAIHDLGKFSQTFQNQVLEIFHKLNPENAVPIHIYDIRHDCLGLLFWRKKGFNKFLRYGLLDENQLDAYEAALEYWIKAVTGHHGQPTIIKNDIKLSKYFSIQDQSAAEQFMDFAANIFLTDISCLPIVDRDGFIYASQQTSWWLSGLTILADWIGSDQNLFKFCGHNIALSDYWQQACNIAEVALLKKGMSPSVSIAGQNFFDLFHKKTPTPLQQKVCEIALASGPQLFILEDVTGAGKTEAALMLAYRLITQGLGQGIYVGLPTMATANAMYKRMQQVYQRIFQANTASLILAHGKSRLMPQFKQTITENFHNEVELQQDELETATSRCHAWLADNRKKALLADIGIGTLDQSLQAILPNKHQSLRLLGLFGKILIVDEVHAYDSYMLKLLEKVLSFHAASGGSAILLSATLPAHIRHKLLKTYHGDLSMSALNKKDYPLISHVYHNKIDESPVATRKEVARTVTVNLSDDYQEVEQILLNALKQGKCVCWIRNTIHDAISTYQRLVEQIGDKDLILFHARFTLGDRIAIEDKILATFGESSTYEQRRGKCVIATQVVEQSLDIDFDFMITDLAPIDLLIQRAGRLQRHKRAGRDETNPTLLIYGPKPMDEPPADWLASFFPSAKTVYANHAQLWLTASLLQKNGGLTMPKDARDLIEGVYGEEAQAQIPNQLLENANKADGENKGKASLAYWSGLNLASGYSKEDGMNWLDEIFTPTRLGDKTVILRLAKWQDGQFKPWNSDGWFMSEVNVRANLLQKRVELHDIELDLALERAEQQLPDKGKWSILLPLKYDAEHDNWLGKGINSQGQSVSVIYSRLFGLQLKK